MPDEPEKSGATFHRQKPWSITLTFLPEPTADGEPATVGKPWAGVPMFARLKKLLKLSKRSYGFRCVDARFTAPEFFDDIKPSPQQIRRRKRAAK